jgi:pescadillo protein
MLTFLEFYQTFMSFINHRLYTSINLVHPLKLDVDKDHAGAGLAAYLIQSATEHSWSAQTGQPMTNTLPIKDTTKQLASLTSKIASLTNDIEPDSTETFTPAGEDSVDIFTSGDPETNLSQPRTTLTSSASNSLFNSLHIYISRETPVDALTFLLLCFHVSSLSTDPTAGPSPYSKSDPRITHQICDRGKLPANIVPGRKYVQPQWVVDSINCGELVDESAYVPGAELPAHLSHFVEKQDWKYDPEAPLDVESESEVEEVEQEEGDEEQEHQRLVVAEAAGEQAIEKKTKKKKKAVAVVNEEKEAKEMAKIMKSNKNRRLLDAMEYGNRKRKGETEKLQSRKRDLIREERKRKKVRLS